LQNNTILPIPVTGLSFKVTVLQSICC